MTELNLTPEQIARAVKHYESLKKHQYRYNHTVNGLEKRKLATKRYYEKNKNDPEFMKRQCEKVKKSQAKDREKFKERAKLYYENKKDEINEKRKQERLLKKMEDEAPKIINEIII